MDSRHINIDVKPRRAVIEIDLNHLHPSLGKLTQVFELVEDDAFSEVTGKELFDSAFRLYPFNRADSRSFHQLPREVKEKIWEEVFEAKRIFFDMRKPDIVSLYVKHPFDFERRLRRYKQGLGALLPDYDIYSPDTRRVFFERKYL